MASVQDVHMSKHTKDKTWWHFNTKGEFTDMSFVKAWWNGNNEKNSKRVIWKSLSPPRAEFLVWFIIQGKLNTRSILRKINLLVANEINCLFCNLEEESTQRVFLHCHYSRSSWTRVFKWRNLQICATKTCEQWLEVWCGEIEGSFCRNLWISLHYVVLWSI